MEHYRICLCISPRKKNKISSFLLLSSTLISRFKTLARFNVDNFFHLDNPICITINPVFDFDKAYIEVLLFSFVI